LILVPARSVRRSRRNPVRPPCVGPPCIQNRQIGGNGAQRRLSANHVRYAAARREGPIMLIGFVAG
jgi:hypothetical protein